MRQQALRACSQLGWRLLQQHGGAGAAAASGGGQQQLLLSPLSGGFGALWQHAAGRAAAAWLPPQPQAQALRGLRTLPRRGTTTPQPQQPGRAAAPSRGFAAQPAPQPQPPQPPQHGAAGAGAGGAGRKSPITFNSMLLTVGTFLAVVAVAQNRAQQKVEGMMQRSQEVVGRAAVGGPFSLVDQDGRPFTHDDLLGSFSVLYFGFTHCPDICPDELEKLAAAVDLVEARSGGYRLRPVFISVDPARDPPAAVKAYVREFHPRLVGLTGSEEAVRACSKAYRVYFHRTGEAGDKDYLVDHSIIMYLVDPAGEFVTFYGKNFTAEQLAQSITQHIQKWQQQQSEAAAAGAGGADAGASAAASRLKTGTAGSQEGLAQR